MVIRWVLDFSGFSQGTALPFNSANRVQKERVHKTAASRKLSLHLACSPHTFSQALELVLQLQLEYLST